MTSNARGGGRILSSLRSADGKGIVRVEERYDTDIDDLWSALTDPRRLARWYGQVEGDLRLGGEFRGHLESWEGTGRVEECDPPRHLVVTTRGVDEPFDEVIEATLTADGDQTMLVIETRGMPLDLIAFYVDRDEVERECHSASLVGWGRTARRPYRDQSESVQMAVGDVSENLTSPFRPEKLTIPPSIPLPGKTKSPRFRGLCV